MDFIAFIVNPHVSISLVEPDTVLNKTINLSLKASAAFKALIQQLKNEKIFLLSDLKKRFRLSQSVVSFLLNNSFIIPLEHSQIYARGIHNFGKTQEYVNRISIGDLCYLHSKNVVIGIPFDNCTDELFISRSSPNQIKNSLHEKKTIDWVDFGNILYFPHEESFSAVELRLQYLFKSILQKNHFPVFLGGDHSITFHIVKSLSREVGEIGIIHFDAHHDVYYCENSLNHLNHANVFYHLAEDPLIKSIHQIGVRTPPPFYKNNKIQCIDSRASSLQQLSKVIRSLPKALPYYLSFDVDVVDPQYAPDVVAPIPDGMKFGECQKVIDIIFKDLNIIGMDVVEVCQTIKGINSTTEVAANIVISSLIAKSSIKMSHAC